MRPTDTQLAQELTNLENDGRYVRVALLKENPIETTELVERDSRRFVRKSLRFAAHLDRIDEQLRLYQLLMTVHSPHLATVYDSYRLGDTLVVISDYVEGKTLRQAVSVGGTFDEASASGVMADLCDAVNALHTETGSPLIHRDIKPDNIIMSPKGAVLIDFGIVRRFDDDKTCDTHIVGTSGYASPEQFGFGQTDQRADIYALGMVMYFMLTGDDPKNGMQKLVKMDRRLSNAQRSIILRCIEYDPEMRYRNVKALRKALKRPFRSFAQKSAMIISSLMIWPIVLIILYMPTQNFSSVSLFDFLLEYATIICFVLLDICPPYVFICYPWYRLKKNRILAGHTAFKMVAIIVLCACTGLIAIGLLQGLHSPEYLALLKH